MAMAKLTPVPSKGEKFGEWTILGPAANSKWNAKQQLQESRKWS